MSWKHYILLMVVAFVVTVVVVPFVRRFAIAHDVVDYPGGRRVNTTPIPRLGGVGIFAGLVVAIVVQIIGERFLGWGGPFYSFGEFQWSFVGVILGVTAMFITGLIDDFVSLTPGVKFGGQLVAACIVVASGVSIDTITNPFAPGLVSLGFASFPVSVFYLVAFANVINLIDGLDGLAAGIVTISTTTLLFLAVGLNRMEAAILACALIGTCLAFLRYNSHPASIFMGDSGSLTIGFLVGVISLLGVTRSAATIAFAVPLIIVAIPILDTAAAIIRRLRAHRPIQSADGEHLHHRLLRRGYGQRKTVYIIYVWSIILAVGGYIVATMNTVAKIVAFAALAVVSIVIIWRLGLWDSAVASHRHESGSSGRSLKRGRPSRTTPPRDDVDGDEPT